MAKYVFAYTGGQDPQNDAERKAITDQWVAWFGKLGSAVVEGGNPFGESKTVSSGSVKDGGTSDLSGFSVITAASLSAAADLAKGCPILTRGGSVEVYETIDVM